MFNKKMEIKKDFVFFDSFYDLNKTFIYNRLKVLNYRNLLFKYRLRFRRYKFLKKIEGIALFKSFLNNFIKLSGFYNRKKFIRRKKRIKMVRKSISDNFKSFFYFIFFYFINKFKIVIDCYK